MLFLGILVVGCAGKPPMTLGVHEGKMTPCPEKPNCVSSQSRDRKHAIDPLPYTGSISEAIAGLTAIITQMKRASIVTAAENYVHAEFKSALFGFIDDSEFYFDAEQKVIQVRSASRIGYSDLGVNRRRIEQIRAQWTKLKKE